MSVPFYASTKSYAPVSLLWIYIKLENNKSHLFGTRTVKLLFIDCKLKVLKDLREIVISMK